MPAVPALRQAWKRGACTPNTMPCSPPAHAPCPPLHSPPITARACPHRPPLARARPHLCSAGCAAASAGGRVRGTALRLGTSWRTACGSTRSSWRWRRRSGRVRRRCGLRGTACRQRWRRRTTLRCRGVGPAYRRGRLGRSDWRRSTGWTRRSKSCDGASRQRRQPKRGPRGLAGRRGRHGREGRRELALLAMGGDQTRACQCVACMARERACGVVGSDVARLAPMQIFTRALERSLFTQSGGDSSPPQESEVSGRGVIFVPCRQTNRRSRMA